jgi:4-aminobutyrate aminotransferase
VLIGKGGLYNNVLRIAPPMSVTLEEATTAIEVLTEALSEVDRSVPGRPEKVGSRS